MAAIADRAGVTRRSAYLHFASRAEVVDALFAHVAETEGLAESVDRVWAAPDAVAALRESPGVSDFEDTAVSLEEVYAALMARSANGAAPPMVRRVGE